MDRRFLSVLLMYIFPSESYTESILFKETENGIWQVLILLRSGV